ncbi:glycoside hydrolase [Auricularia subglabra TFB-10046 SS5]|nr:glycoside hydrolase [Auricularia subglabra TFB-10046 SS5]
MVPREGYDYICSIDSGWSGNGGDIYARIVPDPAVFSWFGFQGLADHLHSKGLKLGVYLLPGAFESDKETIIEGTTNIKLGDVLDFDQPWFSLRRAFKWDADGVQQWHDSVIKNLASLGVDMIKLDYMTPGSPDAGQDLPADMSPAATKFHNAILQYGNGMRLDLSWKLSREQPFWTTWQESADSLRLDQDINNSGARTFTAWGTVQRAIENYRSFINQQVLDQSRWGKGIHIRPDMDNTYVGNAQDVSGLSDVQRYSMAIHWVGAGANLITGSDLTHLDDLGRKLLYDGELMDVAAFTSQWPMQPRNPDSTPTPGGPDASQTQAWVSGPNPEGTAVVVLANYGPDEGSGGFGTHDGDVKLVTVNLGTLGIGGQSWSVRRVLGGGGHGGEDYSDLGVASEKLESWLGPGESVLYKLQKV